MALKDTVKHLRDLLGSLTYDLEKAEGGNKAASQRVRTGTVKFEKIAKLYRKESIKFEKATKGTKKSSAKKSSFAKKAVKKSAVVAKHKPGYKVAAKSKTKAHKSYAKTLSFKRPTAKLFSR